MTCKGVTESGNAQQTRSPPAQYRAEAQWVREECSQSAPDTSTPPRHVHAETVRKASQACEPAHEHNAYGTHAAPDPTTACGKTPGEGGGEPTTIAQPRFMGSMEVGATASGAGSVGTTQGENLTHGVQQHHGSCCLHVKAALQGTGVMRREEV